MSLANKNPVKKRMPLVTIINEAVVRGTLRELKRYCNSSNLPHRWIQRDKDGYYLKLNVRDEHCICAAWKAKNGKIYRGHRHVHCLDAMEDAGTEPLTKGQGFITSTGRFVNREEALLIQKSAGIESCASGGYGHRLYSEDLY